MVFIEVFSEPAGGSTAVRDPSRTGVESGVVGQQRTCRLSGKRGCVDGWSRS